VVVEIVRVSLKGYSEDGSNLKMGRIEKYWTKEDMIEALKMLPQDKPINKKSLKEYSKQKLICHSSTLTKYFGSIKNACKEADVRCDCVYNQTELMNKLNTKWDKENIIEALKKLGKKYGKLKAIDIPMYSNRGEICCADVIRKHFKTIIDAFEQAGIEYRNYYWNKERIIKAFQNIYKLYGRFSKKELRHKFIKEGLICERVHICKQFGSLDNAAICAGIKFKSEQITGCKGPSEDKIFEEIERKKNIKLEKHYKVETSTNRFFIDGYDPINNVAYEVDEPRHRWHQVEDEIREDKIKSVLGCKFERIKLY